jgi:hypothetical protein
VEYFYKECFKAGADCALVRRSDTKWEDIKIRVDALIAEADDTPIALFEDGKPSTVTGHDIIGAFIFSLYKPIAGFEKLAVALNEALNGNFSLIEKAGDLPAHKESCFLPNSTTSVIDSLGDSIHAISCGDADDSTNFDLQYWQSYVGQLVEQSPTIAYSWAMIRLTCAGWKIHPKWRFGGPFTTPEHDANISDGRPAAPLLFLSARLDPVTPLSNAIEMAARHPGARVLIQESAGHAALSAPSACTSKVVRDYLLNGTMPANGQACDADCGPWQACSRDLDIVTSTAISRPPWRIRPLQMV